MVRMLRCSRRAAMASALLLLSWRAAAPAHAQGASRYAAEIARVDVAERRITLKASMGQHTMRVAAGVALDTLKPGDKVLLTFGLEGTESVITEIEVAKL